MSRAMLALIHRTIAGLAGGGTSDALTVRISRRGNRGITPSWEGTPGDLAQHLHTALGGDAAEPAGTQDTGCAGCVGCGGPDCVQHPTTPPALSVTTTGHTPGPGQDGPHTCLRLAVQSSGQVHLSSPHSIALVVQDLRLLAENLAAQHRLPPARDTIRLDAVLHLAAGHPGHHTITVQQLLTTATNPEN